MLGTTDQADDASDPIPISAVEGRDVLSAAKDGYVYRTRGDNQVTLLKREKGLVLHIREEFSNTPEIQEISRIFRITPGRTLYRVKSELTEEAFSGPPKPLGDDTIYLNMRSILQTMTFLSKGVCVPEEHVRNGVAPTTRGPDGKLPYNWSPVMDGRFFVSSQKHRPRNAEVAVQYRGYWFYIPRSDPDSRSVLAILELLFSLQESDGRSAGPLLTLPLGG